MKVGIDNYCLYQKGLMPHEVLKWASENGAEGVAFSGYDEARRETFTSSYLRDIKDLANDLDLYLEWGNGQHVPVDLQTFQAKEIYTSNRRAIGEACGVGATIMRSCSGGLMRWKKDSPSTESLLREAAKELRREASLFRDNGIILAIETHFEFTTFELLRLFEMCEAEPGDYLGICLDTMNLLTMLEDPLMATRRILPWVVSTHIKDGGIISKGRNMVTFPCRTGEGVVDLKSIISLIGDFNPGINLSIEDHGGSIEIPSGEYWFLEQFPDLDDNEYAALKSLAKTTSGLVAENRIHITSRDEWPVICEDAVRKDITYLKTLRDKR